MDIDRHYQRVIHWADRDESTGCLVSRYSVGSHGYAQVWDGKTVVLAHRLVWEHENGPIPEGMTVDHNHSICSSKKCIEIKHLRLLSNYENARRTAGRDWPLGFCINGHPNSELRQYGSRKRCRICWNKTQATYRVRRRAAKKAERPVT